MNSLQRLSLALAACLGLLACGGGSASSGPVAGAPATTLTLRPSLQGVLPPATTVGSLVLTLTLPPGATVLAGADGQVLASALAPAGVAAGGLAVGAYTPAGAQGRGFLRIALIKAEGFSTGEFATITCQFTGPAPAPADFGIVGLAATDVASAPLTGLTATLAAAATP